MGGGEPSPEAAHHRGLMPDGCVCEDVPVESIEDLEALAILIFTIDYLVRLLTVHAVPYR
jgi:hypothetical protein